MLIVVGASPLDSAATRSLFAHMIEHLILTDGIPPLMLLGAPLSLAVAILPPESRRAIFRFGRRPLIRTLTHPALGLFFFIAAIWVVHLSPFFDLALRYAPLHLAEQALFLIAGFALWAPVFAQRGHPWMLPDFVRLGYLFASMPAIAFLGFVLFETNVPLYPSYAAAGSGLADQRNGAELMWVGGSLLMFAAFMVGLAVWARREMRAENAITEPVR
jgi:putative copper resistance protein D